MTKFSKTLSLSLLLAFSPLVTGAQEGWRGPKSDGSIAGLTRASYPETLKLKWKATIGEGHSSPVVWSKKVFTFARKDEREVVSCFDLDTGKQIWSDAYAVSYTAHPAAASHGKGPKATPAIGEGKLFTSGISAILSCYDAATGRVLWRKDFSSEYKLTSPYYGAAASPLYDRGSVIVQTGGHGKGALRAYDAKTGDVKWQWDGDGPGYASPIVVELEGVRQIVTQTQENIVGISRATGQLLWRIPFHSEYAENIVTPLLYKNTLILSGVDRGTFAVKPVRRGETWTIETVWRNDAVPMYMNSPVLVGNFLFGLTHKNKGQYFCLDAQTGKTIWASEGRQGDNAAMLTSDQWLFSLNTDAEFFVFKAVAGKLEMIRKYTAAESATWAHPVITSNTVLIRDASTIAAWSFE
ncbi:MAG TPA: PQQ-binding-like beta-propeller repeat protein [Blastocatellia bacterium]